MGVAGICFHQIMFNLETAVGREFVGNLGVPCKASFAEIFHKLA